MMSSWMRAQAWMNSRALTARNTAAGSSASECSPLSPPAPSQPAQAKAGRTRLPPCSVKLRSSPMTRVNSGSMSSTRPARSSKNAASVPVTASGTSRGGMSGRMFG